MNARAPDGRIPHQHCLRSPAQSPALFATVLVQAVAVSSSWAETVDWRGSSGRWEDAASWGGTLSSRTAEAQINGTRDKPSQVILAHTNVLVNHLGVAEGGNSLASLILDGPSLTVSGTMDVGKYNGSDGRFVVKSGRLFVGMLFVAGGGGPDLRGRGNIEIQGGTVVTKTSRWATRARILARAKAGKRRLARIAMIVITTSSSMKGKSCAKF